MIFPTFPTHFIYTLNAGRRDSILEYANMPLVLLVPINIPLMCLCWSVHYNAVTPTLHIVVTLLTYQPISQAFIITRRDKDLISTLSVMETLSIERWLRPTFKEK